MARSPAAPSSDWILKALLMTAVGAFAYGLWRLALSPELPALYWLVAGGLCLKAGSDRERAIASR